MSQRKPEEQNDFVIERIKERPINKRRLFRRTMITAVMAVIFGLVACFTFSLLEPVVNGWMNPQNNTPHISFPEDPEEMSPEEMLVDNMQQQYQDELKELLNSEISREQLSEYIAEMNYSVENYQMFFRSMSQYAGKMKQCMVKVKGTVSEVDWLDNEEEYEIVSNGLIIYKYNSGLLILADFRELGSVKNVFVSFYNEERAQAVVSQLDSETGLAILTVPITYISKEVFDNENLVAKLGSTNMNELAGTPVIALGNPMGVQGSLGYGIITAATGESNRSDMNYRLLQTNIYGNKSATGVLFNLNGEVLGILTEDQEVYAMDGLLTAYGISSLRKRIEKMSNRNKIPYLGILGTGVSEELNKYQGMPLGAYIEEVEMDSPGMKAGLKQGDIITVFKGEKIQSFDQYTAALMDTKPGQNVKITVSRQSQNEYKEITLEATIGELE